ncbi:MAG: Hsp33 family molecular chaperone HslO [Lachnospiraceae bacterium]
MSDYIVRATAANAEIRAFAATTKEMVEYSRSIHETSPIVTAALGRLLTAGAMMGSMMKGDRDLLTIQIVGDGPVGELLVTANAKAEVKGYAKVPDVMLPPNYFGKLDVGGAVGRGFLRVIKDLGMKEPYSGQTELVSGEIAEDLTYYFATSEQVPSSVGLGVLMNKDNTVAQAGGFIIQVMPFASEETLDKLEERLKNMKSVTTLLSEGNTPEEILKQILGEMDIEYMTTLPTGYHCDCSRDRVERALISLGTEELEDMIRDGQDIETNCQFCNRHYVFTPEDLARIKDRARR